MYVSGYPTVNVADPRSSYEMTRKIHTLFATLYKSMHKTKPKYLPPDSESSCQHSGNMFFPYRSNEIMGGILFVVCSHSSYFPAGVFARSLRISVAVWSNDGM